MAVGDRLKHWVQGNSLKCYGKAHTPVGDVFRVETMTGRADLPIALAKEGRKIS